MKDRLPDLLHGRADESVRTHVAACESCARDLALLAEVRAAGVTPKLDAERLAAAIPAYRRSSWSRVAGPALLRVAAIIVLVLGGATLMQTLPGTRHADTAVVRVASNETTRGMTSAAGIGASLGSAAVGAPSVRPELTVGDPLTDLSDNDLRTLLKEMRDIQPVTSTETDVVVLPAVTRGSD